MEDYTDYSIQRKLLFEMDIEKEFDFDDTFKFTAKNTDIDMNSYKKMSENKDRVK